jgi:hypothetical protein
MFPLVAPPRGQKSRCAQESRRVRVMEDDESMVGPCFYDWDGTRKENLFLLLCSLQFINDYGYFISALQLGRANN